jgi:hypothetical protein
MGVQKIMCEEGSEGKKYTRIKYARGMQRGKRKEVCASVNMVQGGVNVQRRGGKKGEGGG